MESNNILECFEKLNSIAMNLDFKVRTYVHALFKFRTFALNETYLRKKITEQDRSNLDQEIIQLETDIQTLYEEFLVCTIELSEKIENCDFLDFNIINELNFKHFEIMGHYSNVITTFHRLEKSYKNWDFSWIDFSKMEQQKMRLNIAIKKVNEQLLGNSKVQLMNVFEIEKEVFQSGVNKDWEPFWESNQVG